MDLTLDENLNLNASYRLMEDVLSQGFECFYHPCPKILDSNKLVVLADFLPNMSTLTLETWSFFHIKYGTVYVECKPNRKLEKEYICFISKSNICGVTNRYLKNSFMNDQLFFCGNFPVVHLFTKCSLRNIPTIYHFI